jgi:tetratricopeptide (TPR) repeat protein
LGKDLTYLVFSEGLMFLRNNRLVEASNAFKRAVKEDSGNVRYLSYYGLTVALLEKDIPRAISLCRASIDHAPFDPELYFNLSRVHHLAGQRVKALKTLREGLGYEEDSPLLLMALRRMGVRRTPPLNFLPREHLLNKIIGKLTYKLRKTAPRKRSRSLTPASQDPAWIRDPVG